MRGKRFADWITLFLTVGCLLSLLYGAAWAVGINRIVGSNIVAGNGLILGTNNPDTVHFVGGWGIKVYGDSTAIVATSLADSLATLWSAQTIVGTKTFTSASGVILGENGQDGKLTIYSEQGGTDYSVIFQPHATMTQAVTYTLPPDDGTTSQFLQTNGSGALIWATPSGTGDMLTSVYDVAVSGVVDDVDTVGTQIHAALNLKVNTDQTQTVTGTKTFTSASGVIIGVAGTDGKLTLFSEDGGTDHSTIFQPGIQTQNVTYTLPVDDGTTSQFLQTDGSGVLTWATAITGTATDVDTSGTQIHAALVLRATKAMLTDTTWMLKGAIHDSTWVQDYWSPMSPSIDTATETGIDILYPITLAGTPSHVNVVRFSNSSGSNDKKGIFVWSGKLPGGFKADIDSFCIGIVTMDTDTTVTKVNINIYAMNDQGGWALADTSKFAGASYASSVANTWRWITIAGGSIGAIAPLSDVFVHIECTADNGKMIQVEGPERMGFWAWRK